MRRSSDFVPHGADFLVRDLDALGQRAQVFAAVVAVFEPHTLAGLTGEGLDHIGADSLIAGMVERCHGRDETDPVGGLNLTHRFGGVLRDGGPDAENGGSDGVGDITAAWR